MLSVRDLRAALMSPSGGIELSKDEVSSDAVAI